MAAGGTPLLSESSAEQRGDEFVADALIQRFNAHRWVSILELELLGMNV